LILSIFVIKITFYSVILPYNGVIEFIKLH